MQKHMKVKSQSNESIKSIAYHMSVRPQLEYGSEVWSLHTKIQIENVQRRAARWIKINYGQTSSVTDIHHSVKLQKLELRRIDARLSLFYKIHHGQVANLLSL
jgi:hypothetical protein